MYNQKSRRVKKIILLLAGGGTKVLRLFLDELASIYKFASFSDYLYNRQATFLNTLKLTKDQENLIINRDVAKMDITLLCKLIILLFKNDLTEAQLKLILGIKAQRDNFVHSDLLEKGEIEESEFNKMWKDISLLLLDLSDTMKITGMRKEMEEFVDQTLCSTPTLEEISEMLKEFVFSTPEVNENIDTIEGFLDQLKADNERQRLLHDDLWLETHEYLRVRWRFLDGFFYYRRSRNRNDFDDAEPKEKALEYLNRSSFAVLEGDKGSSKTKGAYGLCDKLIQKGEIDHRRCATIINPSEVLAIDPDKIDLVIIDSVGNNTKMTPVWEESLRILEKLTAKYDIKVIITTRVAINMEMTSTKGTFKLSTQTVKLQDLEPSRFWSPWTWRKPFYDRLRRTAVGHSYY